MMRRSGGYENDVVPEAASFLHGFARAQLRRPQRIKPPRGGAHLRGRKMSHDHYYTGDRGSSDSAAVDPEPPAALSRAARARARAPSREFDQTRVGVCGDVANVDKAFVTIPCY